MTDAEREFLRDHCHAMRGTRVADLTIWLLAECDSLTRDLAAALRVAEAMAERIAAQSEILSRYARRPAAHPCA